MGRQFSDFGRDLILDPTDLCGGAPRGWGWAWVTVGHSLQMASNRQSKPSLPPQLAKGVPLGHPKALIGVWVAL